VSARSLHPGPARSTPTPRRSRRAAALVAVLAAVALVVGVAAWAYDDARRDVLAPGVTIGGVDVGGLRVATARARLQEQVVRPLQRTVEATARGRTATLTAREAGLRLDVDGALDQALAASRRGWIGARVVRGITGARVNERLPVHRTVDRRAVRRFAADLAEAVQRDPRSAKVVPHADRLQVTAARTGRRIDEADVRRRVRAALTHRRAPRRFDVAVATVQPEVTAAALRDRFPAYILIDRGAHQLRLYRDLKLARTYPIAVGRVGLETPAGLYDVQWRETNPKWRVPDSDWAGDLAGKTIPPGPDNPIKARWMAFNGPAGIHGIAPSEYGTIGHDASHGCVRMRIPDVKELYDETDVGTPVYVA